MAHTNSKRDLEAGDTLARRSIDIISYLRPKFSTIENPASGLLPKRGYMMNLPKKIASYCCYGMPYRKNTCFWISRTLENWVPLMCDNKNCDAMGLNDKGRLVHLCSAQKGRSRAIWSTDRDFKTEELYIIPSGLVESIYDAINSYGVGDSVY